MPQETNLNVAPYFDDFDAASNYYKVLFKPAYPVQARELNNIQSILQNQIEDVGNHLFKEGAQVIPGQLSYNDKFYAIQIQEQYLGVPVSLYLDKLVGKNITGQTSGITARVVTYINNATSENGNYTLYVNYFNSSTDLVTDTFIDNEVLVTEESINYATTFIAAGEGFSNTITSDASAIGSAFTLSNGVYFLRGTFVDVADEILILDQYSNKPDYRIGLSINEEIISSDTDPTLNDNAQGFNNFSAPGADRLKISATLAKKDLTDYDDRNFVQLAQVQQGILRDIQDSLKYNKLNEVLARRTFDESGHYYVKEFVTSVRESLNDGEGNRGIYNANQVTVNGNTPSDDLAIYKISPGKAYVRGFEVELRGPSFLECPKPRTTRLVEDEAVNFAFGPTLELNNVYGSATIGFNTSNTVSLRSQRVGSTQTSAAGKEIGIGRIYDCALESGAYNTSNSNINQWDLSLFDVQTYTDLTLNENVTVSSPTFIQGESSGATAFLRYDVSAGTGLTAYDIKGDFYVGERLVFNGVLDDARYLTNVNNYGISDAKSVYGIVGSGSTFNADVKPSASRSIGIASISGEASGVSTVTSPGVDFLGIVTTGNLVQYSDPTLNEVSFGRVTDVTANFIKIAGVTTVTGVCDGGLPSSSLSVTDFEIIESKIKGSSGTGNLANNQSIYSIFPKKNLSSIDLTKTSIVIRKQYSTTITDGSTPTLTADANESFLPFDEERYTLVRSDGSTEVLTEDKFTFGAGSVTLTLDGLGANDSASILIATLRKTNVTSKVKSKAVTNNLVINKSKNASSGIGVSTLNDGLTYGDYPFGTRVQDAVISLNVPDVVDVYGIYMSNSTAAPQSPYMTTGSMDGPSATTNDLILGETVTGQVSGAKAIYVNRKTDTSVNFIYLNDNVFENGEVVTFSESGVSAVAAGVNIGSKNITREYSFDNGQESSTYNYSRITRRGSFPEPERPIIVYFSKAYYDSADTGDITTVNSYDAFNYGTEIARIDGVRNTDLIDARPRVVDYTVTAGARSPFEFYGRSFDGGSTGQHSSKNVIASDESSIVSYNYYLPRADRLYLDKDGLLSIKFGTPDDIPRLPEEVNGALNITNIFLPAYLYNVEDAKIKFIDHKRFQMNDISKLEQRIKNLEYYSALNLIENTTLNLFIPDGNGLNRFKSGIFVDNFSTTEPQDSTIGVKNSVDTKKRILRPAHYSTAFNLQLGTSAIAGIGTTTTANADTRFAEVLGTNIKRTNQVITLDYADTSWLTQPFATRTESVTPFLIQFWQGTIALEPTVDVWIDVNRMQARDVMMEGSFQGIAESLQAEVTTAADGTRTGVTPVIWDSWETTGVNMELSLNTETVSLREAAARQGQGAEAFLRSQGRGFNRINIAASSVTTTTVQGTNTLDQTRTGAQTTVNEQIDTETLGDRVVNRDIIHFMRSRNIQFTATKMKPYTQVYGFFDDVDVNPFCLNKLIEISMTSGTFAVGETVVGVMPSSNSGIPILGSATASISFRVANSNHKYGPYNNPTDFYMVNPYDRTNLIPGTYSETSTILNVDTFSLADEADPRFEGYIASGMLLVGQTSGAQATVGTVRLVTDRVGTLIGSYRVPDGNSAANPVFETGRSSFRLTSSPINDLIRGNTSTSAQEIFYSQGDIDNTQEVTLSLRNARVEVDDDFVDTREIVDDFEMEGAMETNFNIVPLPPPPPPRGDPLAQTFTVDDSTGVYLTKLDVYFSAKDSNIPVSVQIRETYQGTPTNRILAYSEVDLEPEDVNLTTDGTVATTFTFESPVYVKGQTEYAIVLLSNSTEYRVWISRLGESDVTTLATEAGQTLVSTQPILGSLFKSQNASVWTPSQYEDLKFTLHRADFVNQGSVQFFNPQLPTSLESIPENGVTINPRKISVGIGTTLQDAGLVVGNTITQNATSAAGKLVGYAGSATAAMSIVNAGVGYTPAAAALVYSGVALTSITGNGIDATANITISNGVAVAATIASGGKGYAIGDVLTPIKVGSTNLGTGMKLSVSNIKGNNELIISEVQGSFGIGATQFLKYTNSSGVTTTLNASVGGNVVPISPIRVTTDGTHVKIFQRNHGMYANNNRVTVKGIETNLDPIGLTASYSNTDTGSISVASTATFTTFENIGVGATNLGYIKIGNEIISYSGYSGNTLTGITRSVDNTVLANHSENDLIYKYELNGVSLRRINTTHNLADVTIANPITLDSYHINVGMNTNGTDRSTSSTTFNALYFNKPIVAGGLVAKGTYNLPFELIVPSVRSTNPTGTNISAQARTISETSISGSEASFQDKNFQEVSLSEKNYFNSPRMVASNTNESNYLTSLPGNKSFTLNLNLSTADKRLAPSIDLEHSSVIFVTNRVNQPVTDYASDPRVNTITDDPNSFIYVTKNVILENPATSLKVYLDSYISNLNDVRVFYALNQNRDANDTIFVPFPGYNNIGITGEIISTTANDGLPDIRVPKIDSYVPEPSPELFREYRWTMDELTPFSSFRIKIIGTSTNLAYVPQFKNLRVVALA